MTDHATPGPGLDLAAFGLAPAAPPAPASPAAPVNPVAQAPAQPPAHAPAPVAAAPLVPASPLAPAPAQTPAQPVRTDGAGLSAYDAEQPAVRIVLDDLLRHVLEVGASDLHLTAAAPPTVRASGAMQPVPGYGPLSGEQLQEMLYGVMTERQRKVFEEELELDFAYALPGAARFRVNIFQQSEVMGAVMRVIPWEIKSLETLAMPSVITRLADLKRGLVLVTGPTGSGKSTTLAAIIDHVNRTRSGHIMTIEDPVEFIHEHRGCIVNQREVGQDTHHFRAALKHVLRQDPDVILVGELRDLETISVALTAAETGHLVFATLHTQSAQDTITRIVDVFPSDQQAQVRTQLAASLQGVVCQTLVPTREGGGRVAAIEVMVCNPGIRALIRDGKLQQVQSALQSGGSEGMQTLNAHLAQHTRTGRITQEAGLEHCSNREEYLTLCAATAPL